MKCKFCGCNEYAARQKLYVDVIVNEYGSFDRNLPGGIEVNCQRENPYGPFQCLGCGAEYESLDERSGNSLCDGPKKDWNWNLYSYGLAKPLKEGFVDISYNLAIIMFDVGRVFLADENGNLTLAQNKESLSRQNFMYPRFAVKENDWEKWRESFR